MTDLLNTQADTGTEIGPDTGDHDGGPRTFRAATLDDAVAAARSAFGRDVELREAHRVRRGGLGGFFATDLGVEILAVPSAPTAKEQLVSTMLDLDPADGFAPTSAIATNGPALDGLQRLIEHAESTEGIAEVRPTAFDVDALPDLADEDDGRRIVSPPLYDYASDDSDDGIDAAVHPFAAAIEGELAAATGLAAEAVASRTDDRFIDDRLARRDVDRDPSSSDTRPASADDVRRLTDWLEAGTVPDEAADVIAPPADLDRNALAELRLPDVSLAAAAKRVAEERPRNTVPRPLMPVLAPSCDATESAPPALPLPVPAPLPPPPPAPGGGLTTDELVASIFALGARGENSFRRIAVKVTSDDGTTMSFAADFDGADDE